MIRCVIEVLLGEFTLAYGVGLVLIIRRIREVLRTPLEYYHGPASPREKLDPCSGI